MRLMSSVHILEQLQDAAKSENQFVSESSNDVEVLVTTANHIRIIPQKRGKRLKELFSVAAENPLTQCGLAFFDGGLRRCSMEIQERTVKGSRTIKDKMKNGSRQDTILFQVSETGHFYIALISHTFADFISDRLWSVLRLLRSLQKLLQTPSQSF